MTHYFGDQTEFLLARIAEDEAAAQWAVRFKYDHPSDSPWRRAQIAIDRGAAFSSDPHVARWDPARVLAECEAKRRIIDQAEQWIENYDEGTDPMSAATLRLLALPYADHPDYDPKWAEA
jgi:hypothetical protein